MSSDRQLAHVIREIVRDEIRKHAVRPPPGEEWSDFKRAVYDAVFMIPHGKVATYGGVARKSGNGKAAQAVGVVLSPLGLDHRSIPWWRVVPAGRDQPYHLSNAEDVALWGSLLKHEGIELDEHGRVPEECVCDW